jgi:fatty-acyl-CoA synthase
MTPVPTATTLPELLRVTAAGTPDAPALIAGDTRWTYAELSAQADLAADVLAGLGVGPGDTVALLAPNTASWVPIAVGAMTLGARVDAFNTWVKAYDLQHLLASSAASVLVLADRVRGSDLLGELESLLPELTGSADGSWHSDRFPALQHVVVLGDRVSAGARSWTALAATATPTRGSPPPGPRSPPSCSTPPAPPAAPRRSRSATATWCSTASTSASGWASPPRTGSGSAPRCSGASAAPTP